MKMDFQTQVLLAKPFEQGLSVNLVEELFLQQIKTQKEKVDN